TIKYLKSAEQTYRSMQVSLIKEIWVIVLSPNSSLEQCVTFRAAEYDILST
ncbi:hypothetical protein CEXT_376641, partial [Caerostris extrusa]